jgi:hypothetical protein
MTWDSFQVWGDVQSRDFKDLHTVGYELFVFIFSFGGKYLLGVSIIQISLVSFALSSLINHLFLKLSILKRNVIAAIILFTPLVGPIAVTMWKDAPFAAFSLLSFLEVLKFENFNKIKATRLIVYVSFACLFRHDGWFTFLLIGLSLLLVDVKFKKRLLKQSPALFILIGCLTGLLLSSALPLALQAEKKPDWVKTISFVGDLAYISANNGEYSHPETGLLMDQFVGASAISGSLSCTTTEGVFLSPDFNPLVAGKEFSSILEAWIHEVRSENIGQIFQARDCRSGNFQIYNFLDVPKYSFWLANGIQEPNQFGLVTSPRIQLLHTLANNWIQVWSFRNNSLAYPSLHLFLMLILLIVSIYKKLSNSVKLLSYGIAFGLARSVTLLLVGVGGDFRFMYTQAILILLFVSHVIFDWKISRLRGDDQ